MKFQTQQFDALYQLTIEAKSRGKDVSGISWGPNRDVTLHVDELTAIRFNGEGFDVYRAHALAEINILRKEALDVLMASAVYSTLVHKPKPGPPPTRKPLTYTERAEKGWITRRANMANAVPNSLDGTKCGLIAAMMLRPEGATAAEIKKVTGWPTICVQRHTGKYGITLTKAIDAKTGYTRYFGTRSTSKTEQALPEIVDVK